MNEPFLRSRAIGRGCIWERTRSRWGWACLFWFDLWQPRAHAQPTRDGAPCMHPDDPPDQSMRWHQRNNEALRVSSGAGHDYRHAGRRHRTWPPPRLHCCHCRRCRGRASPPRCFVYTTNRGSSHPRYRASPSSNHGKTSVMTKLAGMPLSIPLPILNPDEVILTLFMRKGAGRSLSLFAPLHVSAGRPFPPDTTTVVLVLHIMIASAAPSLLLSIAPLPPIVQSIENRMRRVPCLFVGATCDQGTRRVSKATSMVANSAAVRCCGCCGLAVRVLPRRRRNP